MNIPNFDAMTQEDLWDFWRRYNRPTRKDAQELVGDRRPGFTCFASSLAAYACNKAVAMKCRLDGKIQSALCYEQICDSIYARLPEDARW